MPLTYFYKKTKTQYGYCYSCVNTTHNTYFNSDLLSPILKIRSELKDLKKENKSFIKKLRKFRRDFQKKHQKFFKKQEYNRNKDYYKKRVKVYRKNKYNNDPFFRLKTNLRNLIKKSIKNNGYSKDTKTEKILGCSYEEFILYLNDNEYGFKYEEGIYDIDHIIPLSNANNKEELIELNHYTNLQLLPSEYNRHIKRDGKWNKIDFENWLSKNPIKNP